MLACFLLSVAARLPAGVIAGRKVAVKQQPLSKKMQQHVIGHRIVKVLLNRFADGIGGYSYDPVFYLDNGAYIHFVTDETEVGEYGICPVIKGDEDD